MLKRARYFVSLFIFGFIAFCDWVNCTLRKMGTIIDNSEEEKRDLNDSGCVQDGLYTSFFFKVSFAFMLRFKNKVFV